MERPGRGSRGRGFPLRGANWSRGYKTYRNGVVVGFVPPLDRLAVPQTVVRPTDLFETTCSLLDRSRQSISATLLLPAVLCRIALPHVPQSSCLCWDVQPPRAMQPAYVAQHGEYSNRPIRRQSWVLGDAQKQHSEEDAAGRFVARAAQATY